MMNDIAFGRVQTLSDVTAGESLNNLEVTCKHNISRRNDMHFSYLMYGFIIFRKKILMFLAEVSGHVRSP